MGLSQLTQPENAVLKVGLYDADQLRLEIPGYVLKLWVGEGLSQAELPCLHPASYLLQDIPAPILENSYISKNSLCVLHRV